MDFMRNVVSDAAKTTICGPPGASEDANTVHPIERVYPSPHRFYVPFAV
jgi:hypothetical protein